MNYVLAPYRKLIGYVLFAVLQGIIDFSTDGRITSAEIGHLFLTALGLVLVYVLPNAPGAPFVKGAAALLIAGGEVIVAVLDAGSDITTSVWLSALMVVGAAAGVIAPKNAPEPAVPPTATTPAAA